MSDSKGYLLRGGVLLTQEAARPVLAGDLLVTKGRIQALGAVPPEAVPAGVQVLSAHGCAVLPGLVQGHVHLCQTLCRGAADDLPLLAWLRERLFPYEAALSEDDITLAAQLGAAELLLSGTTAILDMGTVHHQDALAAAVAATGLRATIGKAMMDLTTAVPPRLRETTAQSLADSDALCQRWHGRENGRIRYAYAPRFVLSCTDRLLGEVGERVGARGPAPAPGRDPGRDPGPRIHTHAAEQLEEVELVRSRFAAGNVEALARLGIHGHRVTLAHCVHVGAPERQLLAAHGTHVAHCPSSNLKLGSGLAPVVELLQAGVNVALGADGAPCNNRLDGFTELRLAALLQKGRLGPDVLPAARALELATLGGARALGLHGELGSLEIGKRADITVVDLTGAHVLPVHSPISAVVYAAQAADVRYVLVDGQLLVDRGQLTARTGLDVARLRALAGERVPPLLRRAGLA
jgi:5-methylthioadenosine/S-adenosylhomocysteine deaminase